MKLEPENLRRLVSAVRSLSLQPRIPVPLEAITDEKQRQSWVEQKNANVFAVVSPSNPLQMDIFLNYLIDFDDLSRNAMVVAIDDIEFKVSSNEHLIQAKRAVDRPRWQDKHDIEFLQDKIRSENQSLQNLAERPSRFRWPLGVAH